MNYRSSPKNSLADYLDLLQSQGRYFFTKAEALKALNCQEATFERSVYRLALKKRLALIKPGFIAITPIEYKSWGVIPADWIIDGLMHYLGSNYYVGLLSAAALQGASHQQAQQFQVMVDKGIRAIHRGRMNIGFFTNAYLQKIPTLELQTHTGIMKVSIPEATAFDLVRFYKSAGYLNNIATVLSELVASIESAAMLLKVATTVCYEWPVIQRLGYLLCSESVGAPGLASALKSLVQTQQPRFVPLAPYKEHDPQIRDEDWRIFINESIEGDL